MRKDKEKILQLRRQGKTYREIQKVVKISRSTLSVWLKNEEWSKHHKRKNIERHIKISTEHLKKLNDGRKRSLEEKYKKIEKEAEEEFKEFKKYPLFMAGLMLYAGEGNKAKKHLISLSNSEFYIHSIFLKFCEKFLGKKRANIKFWLLLYPDNDISTCTKIWSTKLKVKIENFKKPQVIQGRSKKRKLQYGVCNSIILDTGLKRKLMKWLDMCKIDTLDAGIV